MCAVTLGSIDVKPHEPLFMPPPSLAPVSFLVLLAGAKVMCIVFSSVMSSVSWYLERSSQMSIDEREEEEERVTIMQKHKEKLLFRARPKSPRGGGGSSPRF